MSRDVALENFEWICRSAVNLMTGILSLKRAGNECKRFQADFFGGHFMEYFFLTRDEKKRREALRGGAGATCCS
jgi:hypothetical protein